MSHVWTHGIVSIDVTCGMVDLVIDGFDSAWTSFKPDDARVMAAKLIEAADTAEGKVRRIERPLSELTKLGLEEGDGKHKRYHTYTCKDDNGNVTAVVKWSVG